MGASRYEYTPSTIAAAIFAVLYSVAFLATLVQWIRKRAWAWLAMVIGAGMEALGYIVRIHSTKNVESRGSYIAQFCLIILAPVLMAAAIYVIFGRLVYHVVPPQKRTMKFLWVPSRLITPIFVVCDLIAFFLQAWGAIIITGTQADDSDAQDKLNKGKKIALIGLGVQIICFGMFSIIAIRLFLKSSSLATDFYHRVGSKTGDKVFKLAGMEKTMKTGWKSLLAVIIGTCILILIRSAYRVVEFKQGRGGYISEHEWCPYVFDALPILPCVCFYLVCHPASYLPYLGFRLPAHLRKKGSDYTTSTETSMAMA